MAKSEGAGRNPSVKAAVETRTYVLMRLTELASTLKAHAGERADVTNAIKGTSADSGPELKKLRDRRVYLAKRVEILRHEQKSLLAQKKEINETIAKLNKG